MRISEEVKLFAVQHLAMFDTPSQVAGAVKAKFGLEMTRQQVAQYDPTHEPKPAAKWCQIFTATREGYLESVASIGGAHRSIRLRRLDRMALGAEEKGNFALATQIYEQMAKEEGGLFTNSRRIGLFGQARGGVLAVPFTVSVEDWSSEAATQQQELPERARAAAERATTRAGAKK